MGKQYNTRLIKDDYSYTVEQIADLYGVGIATIRYWIRKEGLKRIPKARPHLVHSSDLRPFLDAKNKKHKHECQKHEVFCFRCQLPRTPKMQTGEAETLANTSVRFKARCSTCGGKMNRNIKDAEWDGNHPLAIFLCDASEEHKGV